MSSSPGANPADLYDEVLQLQGEMNMALEWLLMTKATLNSHQRELAQNTNVTMCQNETQAAKAIKEVEVQYVAMIREAETHYEVMIKEAEAHSATPVMLWDNPTRKVCKNWSMKH